MRHESGIVLHQIRLAHVEGRRRGDDHLQQRGTAGADAPRPVDCGAEMVGLGLPRLAHVGRQLEVEPARNRPKFGHHVECGDDNLELVGPVVDGVGRRVARAEQEALPAVSVQHDALGLVDGGGRRWLRVERGLRLEGRRRRLLDSQSGPIARRGVHAVGRGVHGLGGRKRVLAAYSKALADRGGAACEANRAAAAIARAEQHRRQPARLRKGGRELPVHRRRRLRRRRWGGLLL
mmetsp:Transcript_3004/g.9566  ORF Transcript_3004/g.9566 Transcript_3004/m.9566 type:complete len:235 (+) Transcript_3004:185-889(+)